MAKRTATEQYYADNPEVAGEEAHAKTESERFYKEGALQRLSGVSPIAGITSGGTVRDASTAMAGGAENISDAQKAYQDSQLRDSYTADALARMQAGLGGITAEENQALLEQGNRSINQNQATALRQMRADQGEAGVTGSSAAAQRNRLYSQTNTLKQQNIADLIAKNVAEKGNRLSAYSSAAQTAASQMAAQKDAALARLLGSREAVAGYTQKAEALNQAADQANIENAYKVGTANAEIAKHNQTAAQDVEKFNIGQQEKELAGRIGSYYGDIQTSEARRSSKVAEKLSKEGLRIAKAGVTGSGSKKKKTSKKSKK